MSRVSDDRISHLARLIHQGLSRDGLAAYADDDKAYSEIKRSLIDYFKVEEAADEAAREKIATLKRGVQEGSREWEVLYRKYFEEELAKKGR